MDVFISQNSFIIAQIIGFISMALVIITYQFKSHKAIMSMLIICAILWSLHYICLGQTAPLAMNFVNVLRCIIYYFRDKKWAKSNLIPAAFIVISIILGIISWDDWWSLLPLIASFFAIIANWLTDTKKLKILSVPCSACWLTYNVTHNSWAGTINEIFTLCSIAFYFIRTRKQSKQ